jgi:NAD+ diphosphatase
MEFIKTVTAPENMDPEGYYFIFDGNYIFVVEKGDEIAIPKLKSQEATASGLSEPCFIGMLDNHPCYSVDASDHFEKFKRMNIRVLIENVDLTFWQAAGYARSIHDWNLNFRYCGRCGTQTIPKPDEHVRKCPECSLMSYPRISPAVIIAVVKKDQILLARGVNFPNKKMFSVLAGFVEPDETLEQCVAREVFEETGVKVKDIRYYGSQPWPFPDSLMIGFTARFESGELDIDENEIAEAGWFSKDNLPVIPSRYTIARHLIDWFINKNR